MRGRVRGEREDKKTINCQLTAFLEVAFSFPLDSFFSCVYSVCAVSNIYRNWSSHDSRSFSPSPPPAELLVLHEFQGSTYEGYTLGLSLHALPLREGREQKPTEIQRGSCAPKECMLKQM